MTELRRSCNFCRQRRMKCNGELPWCVACYERNTPCVYESIGARGRPRRKDSDVSSPLHSTSTRPGTAQSGSSSSKRSNFNISKVELGIGSAPSIAQELSTIDSLIWSSIESDRNSRHCLSLDGVDPNTSLLAVLEQLVHLTTGSVTGSQYLELTCQSDDAGIGELPSQTGQEVTQPVLSASQLMQLLELAFTWHPFLSLIVSKTSLLHDHRDGVAMASLLLIVAAEGLDLGLPKAEPLFVAGGLPSFDTLLDRGETELKKTASASSNHLHAMSICQTLLILSYRMIVTARIRRAAVYVSLCCRTLETIRERRSQEINRTEVKMNGVQMTKVEEELLDNIYWLVGSFSLWICLQIPAVAPSLSLNHRLTSDQLPVLDNNQSALYQLDFMSGNLSVLKTHSKDCEILYSLARTYSLIEQYLYDAVPPSPLAFESQFQHPNQAVGLLVSAASRYLGLKSCLAPGPSNKTTITSSHIHILLSFANKTLESTAMMTTIANSRSISLPIQAVTVALQVATISTLVTVFEFLLCFCLQTPYRAQKEVLDKFKLAEMESEFIETNKWQIINIIQSFDTILAEECMSCPKRKVIKSQVGQLTLSVKSLFQTFDPEASTSTLVSPTQVMSSRSIQHQWPDQQAPFYAIDSQPPVSPYYYSLSFGDVDTAALSQPGSSNYASRESQKGSTSLYPDAIAQIPTQPRFTNNEDPFERPWAESSPAMSVFPGPPTPSRPKRGHLTNKDEVNLMPPPIDSILSGSSNHVMLYTPAEFRSMNLDPDLGPSYTFSPSRSTANDGQGHYPVPW